ncbi:NADPH-dependent FMN reductase [Devosia sp. A16]|uniref:NADPH-dependent FMN reductase n=1 Tax=Devosia sp. A16 TaxID=1736675 RepID=UPI0006D85967|nr:NAD(P)H-dependent oxidoreductase [Devosia sp. A16]
MSSKPRIGIILSTTRETRFADRPAQWVLDIARARGDADYEIVDLRDYPMPLFEAAMSPGYAPIEHEVTKRWAAKINELDGYIFITAEYNHSITGALKNALDHVYHEPKRKPAAFVGYGGVGGARAVEQLRLILIELQMAPTRSAVHVGMEPMLGMLRNGKDFGDYDYLGASVGPMLDELLWWTRVLKAGRDDAALAQAA